MVSEQKFQSQERLYKRLGSMPRSRVAMGNRGMHSLLGEPGRDSNQRRSLDDVSGAFCVILHGLRKKRPIAAKKKTGPVREIPNLSDSEQDILSHMEHEYQLETDPLGGDPVLRRLTDDEVMRPVSANRNTVKALEERGIIVPGKSSDPLKIVWRKK